MRKYNYLTLAFSIVGGRMEPNRHTYNDVCCLTIAYVPTHCSAQLLDFTKAHATATVHE